jgi:hypothetical protein
MTAGGLALAALLAWVAWPAGGEGEGEPGFVQLTLQVGGELLDTRFADMDGDGRRDLLVSVLAQRPGLAPRRELRVHTMTADGRVPLEPTRIVPVPDDVIVWGFADVRDEPGRELLLMTRSGVHSVSTASAGLRDNLSRLASFDLLYQVPSPRNLSSWSYVIERPGQRDLLLLAGSEGLAIWGPAVRSASPPSSPSSPPPAGYAALVELGDVSGTVYSVKAPGSVKASAGGVRVSLDTGRSRALFLDDTPSAWSALLQAEMRAAAPALADVDGDGRKDLVFFRDDLLSVHLAAAEGYSATPSRTEALPAWLDAGEGDLVLNLRDLDRDGDTDAYARLAPEQDSLDKVTFTYFVLLNDGRRLFPEQPHQVLRFEGTGTESQVTDVNADGRPDLVVTKYELPTLAELAGGFKFTRSAFVYFATDKGDRGGDGSAGGEPFERKPSLRDEQVFTLDSLQDALVLRHISGDLSGDGIADLVEVDLTGHVVVRRISFESKLFGGGEWQVEQSPWKRLDLGAQLSRLQLEDVNGDEIADLINPGDDTLTLVLSQAAGERR